MSAAVEHALRHLLKPLSRFLDDPTITEIVVNRPHEVAVEFRGGWSWHEVPELNFAALDAIATLAGSMTHQDISPVTPLLGSTLPGGQRIQVVRPPATPAGTISMTIRRPSDFMPSLDYLSKGGLFAGTTGVKPAIHSADDELIRLYLTGDWQAFLALAVRVKKTLIISGDTGSGKTTLAKALISEIPEDERLVTIEDAPEFTGLKQRNVVNLFYSKGDQGQAKVNAEDLIAAALRMRPDRVLMQELRDKAAFAFIRGIAAGHPGSITTCHAGSAAGAFDALRLMVKQHEAGQSLADADVRALLAQLVDVVVHCVRDHETGARSIGEVFFAPAMTARAALSA